MLAHRATDTAKKATYSVTLANPAPNGTQGLVPHVGLFRTVLPSSN